MACSFIYVANIPDYLPLQASGLDIRKIPVKKKCFLTSRNSEPNWGHWQINRHCPIFWKKRAYHFRKRPGPSSLPSSLPVCLPLSSVLVSTGAFRCRKGIVPTKWFTPMQKQIFKQLFVIMTWCKFENMTLQPKLEKAILKKYYYWH